MELTTSILTGQWAGRFIYGEAFGNLQGQEVSFRITLKKASDKLFYGKCIELEGIGLNPHIAEIRGFVEGTRISFVKEYPVNYLLEEGELILNELTPPPLLTYFGEYNEHTISFTGHWELEVDFGYDATGNSITVQTGTWEMSKL